MTTVLKRSCYALYTFFIFHILISIYVLKSSMATKLVAKSIYCQGKTDTEDEKMANLFYIVAFISKSKSVFKILEH